MRRFVFTTFFWIYAIKCNGDVSFSFPNNQDVQPKYRIIGGEPVSPENAYPFIAALFIRTKTKELFCGGSLIYPQWVLTAAHCLDFPVEIINIYLGSFNLGIEEQSRQVFKSSRYFVHSGWDEDMLINDIALIKLPTTAILNDFVNLVTLETTNYTSINNNSTIIGWGFTENHIISPTLQYVVVDVISNEECKSKDPSFNLIVKESHICTSGAGIKGSCNGDSGGPLMINKTQIGLVSFGPSDCLLGLPSVYTRVSDYIDWINETIENRANSMLNFDLSVLFVGFNILLKCIYS